MWPFIAAWPLGDNVGYSCWFGTRQTEFPANGVLNEQDTQQTTRSDSATGSLTPI